MTKVIVSKTAVILRFGHEDEARIEQSLDETKRPARGFSVSIRSAVAHSWAAGGLTLEQTTGRGWIEWRGGPAIEILDAHQIELADDGLEGALAPTAAAPPAPPPPRRRTRRASRETAAAVVPVTE